MQPATDELCFCAAAGMPPDADAAAGAATWPGTDGLHARCTHGSAAGGPGGPGPGVHAPLPGAQRGALGESPADPAVSHVGAAASLQHHREDGAAFAAAAATNTRAAAVTLLDVQQAYTDSRLSVQCTNSTGEPMPNAWGRRLLLWSDAERCDLTDAGCGTAAQAAARLCLAQLLWCGQGGMQKDEARARALAEGSMAWCRGAAEGGEAVAQWLLGRSCDGGWGADQDSEQAAAWYRRAAEQGNAVAQNCLGVCYGRGEGVAQDWGQAVAWFRRAAEQGYAVAQCNLGMCYTTGGGVRQNAEQAVAWLQRAAKQGYADAQYSLGACIDHWERRSVAEDLEPRIVWWQRAAEQGHSGAQFVLGVCYEHGEGVEHDQEQAVAWYRRAAEQGHAAAKSSLRLAEARGTV